MTSGNEPQAASPERVDDPVDPEGGDAGRGTGGGEPASRTPNLRAVEAAEAAEAAEEAEAARAVDQRREQEQNRSALIALGVIAVLIVMTVFGVWMTVSRSDEPVVPPPPPPVVEQGAPAPGTP